MASARRALPHRARREGGLGFTGTQIGLILGLAGSIGAVASPFIAGQLADRHFSTERFLAVLLAVGGVIKWVTASPDRLRRLALLSIAYSVVYMPTLALSNSMAFANLDDRDRQFPKVRVWGTIGWIAASWIFPMIYLQSGLQLPADAAVPGRTRASQRHGAAGRLAPVLGADLLGLRALLSHPAAYAAEEGRDEKLAFAKAFRLLREPLVCGADRGSLPISVIHQIYFLQTPPFLSHLGLLDSQIGPAMTIGQFSEIIDHGAARARCWRGWGSGRSSRSARSRTSSAT